MDDFKRAGAQMVSTLDLGIGHRPANKRDIKRIVSRYARRKLKQIDTYDKIVDRFSTTEQARCKHE